MRGFNRFGRVGGLLLLSACPLFIAGCGKSKKALLIGTWHADGARDITLNPDGTCTLKAESVLGKAPGEPLVRIYGASAGNWTLDGDTITVTCHGDFASSAFQVDNSPEKFKIVQIDETKMGLKSTGDGKIQERTKAHDRT